MHSNKILVIQQGKICPSPHGKCLVDLPRCAEAQRLLYPNIPVGVGRGVPTKLTPDFTLVGLLEFY